MPVFNNALAGAAGQSGGAGSDYTIEQSLRFNEPDSAFLSKTLSTKETTFTLSFWFKRSKLGTWQYLWSQTDGSGYAGIGLEDSNDRITLYNGNHNFTAGNYRDVAAWYHAHLKVNSGAATLYINGEQVATANNFFLGGGASKIGDFVTTSHKFSGYIADFQCVSGSALDPTDMGEFSAETGSWNPIEYTGDYNTAGSGSQYLAEVTSSNGFNSSYPKENMFDGSTSTRCENNSSTSNQHLTWTPTTPIQNVTSLRVYALLNSNQYDAREVSVNGGSYYNPNVYGSTQWWDLIANTQFNSGDTLTEIKFQSRWHAGGAASSSVRAIEVNGTILQAVPAGVNGFHLDFDPTAGQVFSSGTLTGAMNANNPITRLFDGSLSTGTWGVPTGFELTFPSPVTVASSITFVGGSTQTNFKAVVDGTEHSFTWPNGSSSYTQEVTINVSGSFTGIKSNNNYGEIRGIRVDGGPLLIDHQAPGTDASGERNHWTPNNFLLATTSVTHWRQAGSADNPSSGSVGSISYRPFKALTNPQTQSLVWDHQNTQIFGLQNITGITSLRLLVSSRGSGAKIGLNAGAMFTVGSHGGDYGNAQANAAWYTVSNPPSTLTSIAGTGGGSGTGNFMSVWGIEVNGTRVVDTSGADCDSLLDSPTNYNAPSGNNGGNYVTLNPLQISANVTLSNGNLDYSTNGNSVKALTTIGMSSGKWYAEFTPTSGHLNPGIAQETTGMTGTNFLGNDAGGWIYSSNGKKYHNDPTAVGATYGASYNFGDVIGVAFDADNGTLTFYKNGASQGVAYTGLTSGPYFFACGGAHASGTTGHFNGGQRPFSISSIPTGYKPLCTQNLDDPLIDKGSDHFIAKKYNGVSGDKVVTTGFQPDLVWIKNRTQARWHRLADSVRGVERNLYTNSQSGEDNSNNYNHKSFDSTGFTVWDTDRDTNSSHGDAYISWSWKGGSTFSNSAGSNGASIASSGTANTISGFSIVSYQGNGSSGTVFHGLSSAPNMIWVKDRDSSTNWYVFHSNLGGNNALQLNSVGGVFSPNPAGINAVSSSTFTLGGARGETNTSGDNYIAYCFSNVESYCKIGKFSGNASSNGTFVNLNFRPSFLMVKANYNYDGGGTIVNGYNWFMYDSERSAYNLTDDILAANKTFTEESNAGVDFLSNGFKMRNVNAPNANYTQYYIAFAENPFKYARAR